MIILNFSFSNCQISYIKVSDSTIYDKSNTSIVVNPNNNEFIIFFQSKSASNDYYIFAKRFDINGKNLSNEVRINTVLGYEQIMCKTTLLTDGKIIAVWQSKVNNGASKIQGRLVKLDLSFDGEEFNIDSINDLNGLFNPSVCKISNKRFIVFYNYSNKSTHATIYNSDKILIKSYFQINYANNNLFNLRPTCAEFSDNSIIIIYPSKNEFDTDVDIYAKIFNSQFELITNEFKITSSNGNQSRPLISIAPNDNVLIIYESTKFNSNDIFYKVYNKDFSKTIREEANLNSYTKGEQIQPVISRISDNINLVCWRGPYCETCSFREISCKKVDFQGKTFDEDSPVNKDLSNSKVNISIANINTQQIIIGFDIEYSVSTTTKIEALFEMNYHYQKVNVSIANNQTKPLIVPLKSGDFIIFQICELCENSTQNVIRYKYYNSNGMVSYSENLFENINPLNNINDYSAVTLSNGNIFVVWDDLSSTTIKEIYGKIINSKNNIIKVKFQITDSSSNSSKTIPKIITNNNGINLVIWNENLNNSVLSVSGYLYNDNGDLIPSNPIKIYSSNLNSNACFIGNNNFLILYDNYTNNTNPGVFMNVIQQNSGESSNEILLIINQSNKNFYNSGCALIGGSRIVVLFRTDKDVFFKIFNQDFSLFKNTVSIDTEIYERYNPTIINLISGEFVIGWEEKDSDGSGLGVYYKIFDQNGVEKQSKLRANTFTYRDQKNISIGQLIDKSIIVAFSSWGDGELDGIYYDFIINCPENRYIDFTLNNRCSLKDCKTFEDNCNICPSSFYKLSPDDINCVNSVISPQYLSNPIPKNGYFLKCSLPCATCVKSIENCQTCISQTAKLVQISIDKITCLEDTSGYYLDLNSNIYKKCDDSCLTCIENSKKCQTCNNQNNYLYKLEDNIYTCVIKCPDGYCNIPENGICKACSKICKTCESDINNCKSCTIDLYLVESENKMTCISNSDGYYFDVSKGIFKKCSQGCKKCINPTNCISCDNNSGFLLVQNINSCVLKCPDGYWKNFLENKCMLCNSSCKLCLDDTNNCLECAEGYLTLKENKRKCFKECPPSYKYNSIENYCESSCISPCNTCTDSNNCIDCIENHYLISISNNINNCVADCPDGFYNDNISLKCQTCPVNCKTCKNSETCLSCKNEKFYFEEKNLCLNSCPIKYYTQIVGNDEINIKTNESKNTCKKCKSECSVCTGSQDNCLSCEQGYFYYTKGKDCLVDCPQGYYKNFITNECQGCDLSCLECKANLVNDCIKCNENLGFKLNNGLCLKETGISKIVCPIGFIEIEKKCLEYKFCIQNFYSNTPKIFSIDSDDFIIKIFLTTKNECKIFSNKFDIIWDKDNPFYINSKFSQDMKILTINSEFLKEGEYIFVIKLLYNSYEIDKLTINTMFKIDNVRTFVI